MIGRRKLLIFTVIGIGVVSAVTITCNAPPVVEGQTAQITCNFHRNVSNLTSATVTVERYIGTDPANVLDCTPVRSGCKAMTGYHLEGRIGTHLVLKIPEASKGNEGRYACKMLSPDLEGTDDVQPCEFTLGGTTSTTVTTTTEGKPPDKGVSVGLIAGVVVCGIIVLVAVVVIVVTCRIKKWPCFKGDTPTSASWTKGGQETSDQGQAAPLIKKDTPAPNAPGSENTRESPPDRRDDSNKEESGKGVKVEEETDDGEKKRDELPQHKEDEELQTSREDRAVGGDTTELVQPDIGALAKEDTPEEPNTDAGGAKESVTEENRSRNDAEEEEDKDDKEKGPSVLEQVRAIESKQDAP